MKTWKDSIRPFYVGQKVVYVTGINMPKNSIHVVSEVIIDPCGCVSIGIDNVPVKFRQPRFPYTRCDDCGKEYPSVPVLDGDVWEATSFRPLEEKPFPLITLSKIQEKQEILIAN